MKTYLAGPEVFLRDAVEILNHKKYLCQRYGHLGITPFDANIGTLTNTHECGVRIAAANELLIDQSDAVIANITPFRGHNADPGTVFEIGYARAKGKVIYAYSLGGKPHAQRLVDSLYYGHVKQDGEFQRDVFKGWLIDDFQMVENAMIDGGITLSGGKVDLSTGSGEDNRDFASMLGFERCLRALNGQPSNQAVLPYLNTSNS